MEYKTSGKLGWGLKKWVFTRPDIWKINQLIWDEEVGAWYVRALSIYNVDVDFHASKAYVKSLIGNTDPTSLVKKSIYFK